LSLPCLDEGSNPSALQSLSSRVLALEKIVGDGQGKLQGNEVQLCKASVQDTVCTADDCSKASHNAQDKETPDLEKDVDRRRIIQKLRTSLADQAGDKDFTVKLEPSTWSLWLFVGIESVTFADSLCALLVSLLNIGVQASFCGIIMTTFKPDKLTNSDADEWRWSVGHAAKFADTKGQSLIHRVCQLGTLEFADEQKQTYFRSKQYTTPFLAGLAVGPTLTSLCLLMWLLSLWDELRKATELLQGLCQLPKALHITEFRHDGADVTITSISYGRLFAVALSVLMRLAVVAFLSYSGTMWLVYMDELQDLLLSCTALTFILDVDEMLFQFLAPGTMQCLVDILQPIQLNFHTSMRCGFLKPLAASVAVLGVMAVISVNMVMPEWSSANDLQKILCGNRTDFVVGEQFSTGIAVAFSADSGSGVDPLSWDVAKNIAAGRQQDTWHIQANSVATFQETVGLPLDWYTSHGSCSDFNSTKHKPFLSALRHAAANQSLASCQDLQQQMCSLPANIFRIACPVHCGCNQPRFGIYVTQGCPRKDCTTSRSYVEALASLRVTDPSPFALAVSPAWRGYWDTFESDLQQNRERNILSYSKVQIRHVRSLFNRSGCGGLAELLKAEPAASRRVSIHDFFCSGQITSRRPVSPFCPETCKCQQQQTTQNLFCNTRKPQSSPCPGITVQNATALGCEFALPHASSPNGLYGCTSNGYNMRHLYSRTDAAGVNWTIRFETEANLDWGASFLGKLEGMGGLPKWTLQSTLPGTQLRHSTFHSYLVDSTAIRTDSQKISKKAAWRPRSVVNTNLDCAAPGMFIGREFGQLSTGTGLCLMEELSLDPCNNQTRLFFYFDNKTIKHDARPGKCLTVDIEKWFAEWQNCNGKPIQSWYFSGTSLQTEDPRTTNLCAEEVWDAKHYAHYIKMTECRPGLKVFQWFFGWSADR